MTDPVHSAVPVSGPDAAAETLVEQSDLWSNAWKYLRRSGFFITGSTLLLLLIVMALVPQLFAFGKDPRVCDLYVARQGPSAAHWFGTDLQGCDYYANVIYGARISLSIGLLSMFGVLLIGVIVGAVAGYFGGIADSILARLTDVFFGIPMILGGMILLSVVAERSVFSVAGALIAFGWMTAMRLVRSSVMTIKQSDYVQAATALGASTWRILVRHILPNALAPVLVYATIAVGTFIAAEATLTYMGIGLQRPAISWGLQINDGQARFATTPLLVIFPALFLSASVLGFIMVGDALRDALDPRRR
ncbi:ABC transporter permease [Mycobacterium sp. CBMA271]|uniref:ABC transporter permease n=1 Tax=unclassified Mycobacteroides TaxID=2618759 RepID=UPI0012DFA64E|nr:MULTISPECIES: ABC transporter permease [unclassified Mycobacteroides]MUM19619.1 peptide ABC transporter permease [Mycobacteroides sp. CBMA 326]MUM24220.1 ABC transporter permease [Mycobacteroides sp. CBMA 271]